MVLCLPRRAGHLRSALHSNRQLRPAFQPRPHTPNTPAVLLPLSLNRPALRKRRGRKRRPRQLPAASRAAERWTAACCPPSSLVSMARFGLDELLVACRLGQGHTLALHLELPRPAWCWLSGVPCSCGYHYSAGVRRAFPYVPADEVEPLIEAHAGGPGAPTLGRHSTQG